MRNRERKQVLVDKQRAKKAKRQGDAFLEAIDRWMRREPPEAFTDKCPGCRGDIYVTYEAGRMQHGHPEPVCELYKVTELLLGNESVPLECWKNPELPAQLPEWTDGPHTELTMKEGVQLMGKIDNSIRVDQWLPDGSTHSSMIIRNKDGLFWWPLSATPPMDDEGNEADEGNSNPDYYGGGRLE